MLEGRKADMNEDSRTLFREKNLKEAAAPEQLDTCLKVTGFRAWFAVAAAGLVLLALFLWVFCARIINVVNGAGYCKGGVLTCYFPQAEAEEISAGDSLKVDGTAYRIKNVNADLFMGSDIPNEVLFLLPESKWYRTVDAAADLPDGLYSAKYEMAPITPASYLTKGE